MTANSILFCDEDVRDAAKDAFGDLIPKYDKILVHEIWHDIWSEEGYPNEGVIVYTLNGKHIAEVHFKTKFVIETNHIGKSINAMPTELVLKFPDGRIYRDREWLIGEVKECIQKITELRDDQEAVPCNEECLCNSFDLALDRLRELIDDIRSFEVKENDAGAEVRTSV